jgi:hypothetical protein
MLFLLNGLMLYSQVEIKKDTAGVKSLENEDGGRSVDGSSLPLNVIEDSLTVTDVESQWKKDSLEFFSDFIFPDFKPSFGIDLVPKKWGDKMSYSLVGYSENLGIGQYNKGGLLFMYEPTDKLKMSMGMHAVYYNIWYARYRNVVADFNISYQFNNWMKLVGFGQYSFNANYNSKYGGYMFSPKTEYGTYLQFDASEKVKWNVGWGREYNPLLKQWQSKGIMGPVIRFK